MWNGSEPRVLAFVAFLAAPKGAAHAATLDTAQVEQLTGAKGQMDAREGVFRVSVPRGDLQVTVAGTRMAPPMGLTSWASPQAMFMHIGGMGDERTLATAVGKVFARMKETAGGKGEPPAARVDPARSSLDASRIDAALGVKGTLSQGLRSALARTATPRETR